MNEIERKFLLAVERGDLTSLKILLASNDRRLDINCCDPLARNALIIAIDNENLEMVKLLIEHGIRIGDALLYAIDESFVEAVELLLEHDEATVRTGNPHYWEKDHEHSSFSADMTPLILAAHRNNFEIIKMLLDRRVSAIPDPHDPRCDCKSCSTDRNEDCLRHSRSRINAYRALASPCLMALSSPDPLLTAFEMSAKLENLAVLEPEYKSDYLKLRAQCQTFATKLLDHTRTSKELEVLLNYSDEYLDDHDHDYMDDMGELCCQGSLHEMSLRGIQHQNISLGLVGESEAATSNRPVLPTYGERKFYKRPNTARTISNLSLDSVTGKFESYQSHMRLARLRMAIQCRQKTFCAHPNIQELLATMWYENLPGFRRKSPLAQMLQVIFIGLMFPVYSIAYLVAPHSQLGRYIKKPFIKFICHSASYITFLLVLILASQRVEAFYSWDSFSQLFSLTGQAENKDLEVEEDLFKQWTSSGHMLDDTHLIAAFYKKLSATTSASGARGLDSLSKMFERLPASSKKRGSPPSPIEVVILVWVVSLIWAEIKQLRALGMNYYRSDMWNTLDSVASGFYVATIILRIVSYIQAVDDPVEVPRERWGPYDPTLLSEGLFAAATIFSALKLVYIFSVNPYLGPLQISLSRMIIDILQFSWIYILVLFSFACGMNQLLWYYADLERHQCVNITNYMLAQYYSSQQPETIETFTLPSEPLSNVSLPQNVISNLSSLIINDTTITTTLLPEITTRILNVNISDEDNLMEAAIKASFEDDTAKPPVTIDDSCKTWRYFSNVFESVQTLFWATFGLVDLSNFDLTGIRQYTRFWALLMFGCYCFINVIVVLNLLIAMMNHSYVKISKKSDIEWKFARTRLWMSYFDTGSTVPAPFNIIPSIKSFVYMIRSCANLVCRLYHLLISILLTIPAILLGKTRRSEDYDLPPTAPPNDSGKMPQIQIESVPMKSTNWRNSHNHRKHQAAQLESLRRRERSKRNCSLTASYRSVMRSLVRRYLVKEQRLLERKRELTEAKLNRWAKLAAFEK